MPTLYILTEGFPNKSFELREGVTTVGRDDDNAIHVPDSSLSGNHGQFVVSNGAVVFQDLDSTNGSFIDDNPIAEAPLPVGTIFRLGSVVMQIGNGGGAPAAGKRTTSVIMVAPAGIKPGDLRGGTGQIHSPFKHKKSIGTKVFNIILIIVGIAIAVLLGITILKS